MFPKHFPTKRSMRNFTSFCQIIGAYFFLWEIFVFFLELDWLTKGSIIKMLTVVNPTALNYAKPLYSMFFLALRDVSLLK